MSKNQLSMSTVEAIAVYRILSPMTIEHIEKANLSADESHALMSLYSRCNNVNLRTTFQQTFSQISGINYAL